MAQSFYDSHEIHIMLLLAVPPFLYFILKQLISQISRPPLPPGPTPWPILGTLHLFKPLTHISLYNLAQSYGPLMLLKLGTENLIVGSSPSAAAQILKANDRILSARAVPHAVPLTRSEIDKASFWADADGDHWKNIRTICRKGLFSGAALESQAVLREQKMVEMLEWLRSKEGKVVNVQNMVFATVFNMFTNALFSKDVINLGEEFGDIEVIRGFLRGIIEAISIPNVCDFYPFLGKFDPQGLRRKHREMSMRMWALWERIVKERRSKSEKGGNQDLLDTLVSRGFTDDQINKLFEELLTAGLDTTTSTISRTISELLSSPESMTGLKRELGTVFNNDYSFKNFQLKDLPYLEATIKETLRLHPPAPLLLSHRATDTCQVMNFTIPKNARVLVNVWAIGRDPKVWDEPLQYSPERFLDSTRDFKGNDFEFLPFGSGRRICPGLPMAAEIVPLLVGCLMYFFEWSSPDGVVNEKLRVTSQMMQPLLLIPKARK